MTSEIMLDGRCFEEVQITNQQLVCLSNDYDLRVIDDLTCRPQRTLEVLHYYLDSQNIPPTAPHIPSIPLNYFPTTSENYAEANNEEMLPSLKQISPESISTKDQVLIGLLSCVFVIAGMCGIFCLCKIFYLYFNKAYI